MEWDPPEARHKDAVLVPVLGDHYGRVLEASEIQLAYEQGNFIIRYHENVYPVDPSSIGGLLARAARSIQSEILAFIAESCDALPQPAAADRENARRRSRNQAVLRALLNTTYRENPRAAAAVDYVVEETNRNPDLLDELLEKQNFRLAYWRITQRELGYRRFFDINTLIGLRMEDTQVFEDTHGLILEWLHAGYLDGLRIDHPDGLADPEGYFRRLREARPGVWVLIEKILEHGERLPYSWPVAGTTGYDFMYRISNLFVDPRGEDPLTRFYISFAGISGDYESLVLVKKRLVAGQILGSDLNRLTELFLQVIEKHRRYRDYTRGELRRALLEIAACLPVYRTYVRPAEGQPREEDEEIISSAVKCAKENLPDIDPELLDFFEDLVLLKKTGEVEAELVGRFQQFTGPVMAKGVEDTTFYLFNRLVSLNEVGGDPGTFGITVDEFHQACQETQAHWPETMLSTSTHDTKRGEDVRARLAVLSEIPDAWEAAVRDWARINEQYRSGDMPDRNDEYVIYQTLLGAWPISTERMQQYMEKAVREAKVHSSWTNPDQTYEKAVENFLSCILEDGAFRAGLEGFLERIKSAGWVNGLSTALVKLTSPGVPDIYQGSELWNLSLVDPDNRRPVDYQSRQGMLNKLASGLSPEDIWSRVDTGLPKLWVVKQALRLRHLAPTFFGEKAVYTPIQVQDASAPGAAYLHALAYGRGDQDQPGGIGAVIVIPRLLMSVGEAWDGAKVTLPAGQWRNPLTGDVADGGEISVAALFSRFPVCLLCREEVFSEGAL
jgi:(1->4)-alpha-D-glucan 1-alpha-D-glucosylmutase